MNRIHRIRRIATALAGLAVTWLGLVAAPAAFAEPVPPGGGGPGAPGPFGRSPLVNAGHGRGVSTVTRTVVVGGMPGWQIALIAVAAALVAASLAVLAGRARAARRISIPTAA